MFDYLIKFDYNFFIYGLNYYVKKKLNVIVSKINLINWIYIIYVLVIKNYFFYWCWFFWLISFILIEFVYKKNMLIFKYI